MKIQKNQNIAMKLQQFPLLFYLFKWLFLSAISGACIGSASALLLVSLEWATQYREHHLWIIALLPVAGLVIGLMYHYLAGTASRGNNFLIEEIRSPHDIIPFRSADGRGNSRPFFQAFPFAQTRPSGYGGNRYQCRLCFYFRYTAGRSCIWPGGNHCGKNAL